MKEAIGLVTLIEEHSKWTQACKRALQKAGTVVAQQNPSLPLSPENIDGGIFVVPVSTPGSERFDLIGQISDYGGFSLVLTGSRQAETSLRCLGYYGVACVGAKGLDFDALIEGIELARSLMQSPYQDYNSLKV
jgi:hypothetical protein